MSEILTKYQAKKVELLSAFDALLNHQIIPCEARGKRYDEELINELKGNLENEKFTISVCGQINAGKSSFLNYLLFKDKDVLPTDDTPWTAKLSTIQYGETDMATVTYYNSDEWSKLKDEKFKDEDTNEETTYYNKFLKTDVNRLASDEGIYAETYITTNNKVEANVPLNQLNDYVTKNGKFTPFVSHVDITVNNELAKGVVFVDTPGLNDRNILRSKVTEDWIIKSSAVIYLLYTGQPLAAADYRFIDEHLSNISSSKLIFVLTKADTSNDYEGALNYVNNTLHNDPKLKDRRLLGNKKVYPISTIAAKIHYLKANNLSLNEDEEFHLERIEENCPSFIEEQGYIPCLVEGIQEHIMRDKGAALLSKAQSTIEEICKAKESEIKLKALEIENNLDRLDKSHEKLKTEQKDIEERSQKVNEIMEVLEYKQKDFYPQIKTDIADFFSGIRKEIIKEVNIDAIDKKSLLYDPEVIQHRLRDAIENHVRTIRNKIKDKRIFDSVTDFQKDYVRIISKELKLSERTLHFSPPIIDPYKIIESLDLSSLNASWLKNAKVYKNRLLEFIDISEFWDTSDLESTKEKLKLYIEEVVKNYLNNYTTELNGATQESVNEFLNKSKVGLNNEFNRIRSAVEKAEYSKNQKDELIAQRKQQLAKVLKDEASFKETMKMYITPLLN